MVLNIFIDNFLHLSVCIKGELEPLEPLLYYVPSSVRTVQYDKK